MTSRFGNLVMFVIVYYKDNVCYVFSQGVVKSIDLETLITTRSEETFASVQLIPLRSRRASFLLSVIIWFSEWRENSLLRPCSSQIPNGLNRDGIGMQESRGVILSLLFRINIV